jgi:hypothetical protein
MKDENMKTCDHCGGILGVDCFNPSECGRITMEMEAAMEHQREMTENKPSENMRTFNDIEIGGHFRIPGYDDLFQKVSSTHAKDKGCSCLRRPTRFARTGEFIMMTTPGTDFSNLTPA